MRVELGCPSTAVSYNNQSYAQGSDNRFSFDASGRAVTQVESNNTWVSTQGPPPRNFSTNKNTNKTTTTTSTYDAENHLANFHPVIVKTTTNADTGVVQTLTTDHGTTTVGWGPNGHPVSVQNLWMSVDVPAPPMTLHWDGDALLYVTNASGTVINFKVGLDGDVNPTDSAFAGLVAYDRDRSGTVIQCNSTAGNSGFINPADANPNGIACTTQAGGFTAPVMTYLPYVRSDGFAGLPVQINGVRAYDPKLGNWTTPDAYEGDVHDPGSQQRYMWNRNNPYDYSDPSGYNPFSDGAMAAVNFLILDDWRTAKDPNASGLARGLAVVGLLSNLGGPGTKGGTFALKSIIKISEKQIEHAAERHFAESAEKASGKFAAGTTQSDLRGMVEKAIDGPKPSNISWSISNGEYNIKILTDFGRTIGTSNNKPTSIMASFYDLNGDFLSAYPVKK